MHSDSARSDKLFLYGMIASMFCWGLSWSSGKILTSYGNPMQISFYRFLLTFLSLLLILLFTKEKLTFNRLGARDLVAASLLIALYTYFFFKGLTHGLAGAGGVLVTTLNPIISYFIMLFYKQRGPSRREGLGLLVGLMAGCTLLSIWNNWRHTFDQGNSYFLMASFTWALLSLFTSRSSKYGSPVVFSLWMYGLCSLLMFSLVGFAQSKDLFFRTDALFWTNLVFSATVTTAFATTFYFVATTKLGASKASSYIFLVPFSALGSFLFLDEIPQLHTIIGGMMGIAAVYIINKK